MECASLAFPQRTFGGVAQHPRPCRARSSAGLAAKTVQEAPIGGGFIPNQLACATPNSLTNDNFVQSFFSLSLIKLYNTSTPQSSNSPPPHLNNGS